MRIAAATLLLLAATGAQAQDFHLPTSIAEANGMEKQFLLPIGPFYDTPAALAAGKPGDLLRQEVVTGYDLPKRASRRPAFSITRPTRRAATSPVRRWC